MEDRRKGLTIDVSITDTEVFKGFVGVVSKIIMDKRMDVGLKRDAMQWLWDIGCYDTALAVESVPKNDYQQPEQIVILCETISLGKSMWQHRKHRYNPHARLTFLGKDNRTIVDGLRPDKVIRLRGWEESKGAFMNWLTLDGEKPEVIDETGECQ